MLKLLVGAALFVCCGYVGYGVSAHYRRRYNLLVGVIGYIDALINGISYLQSTLEELTSGYAGEKKDDLGKMLAKYILLLKNGSYRKEDCAAIVRSRLLTGYEQNALAEMLYSLGKSDIDTQLSELNKYRALISPIAAEAGNNYKKYGSLAFKLGILAGLAALLITA